MVSLKSILPLAAAGLAIFFLGNAIARPAQARLTGQALTETGVGLGSSLSSIGGGIGSLLGNIGTGSAQIQNASNYTIDIPTPNTASSSPAVSPESQAETKQSIITFPSGARTTYPLSQAAIDYYRNIGVEVS
jgi:hypothetical protein